MKWTEKFKIGDRVEFNVPAFGWCKARIIRKTRTGVPIVCTDTPNKLCFAAGKKDIRPAT